MSNKKIIAIVGPTGSGKTDAAITLAKKLDGVIISADSRQVYEKIDAGTNKVGTKSQWLGENSYEVNSVHQLMINVAKPGQTFTLNDWLTETKRLIEKIHVEGKLPIICGGTGLYVTALVEGYIPGSGRGAKHKGVTDFDSMVLQFVVSREKLYQKSDRRIENIIPELLAEVGCLIESGVARGWLTKLGLDYRFATLCLQGELTETEAVKKLQQASRQYIRRQITWWRHHSNPKSVTDTAEFVLKVKEFLKEK